MTKDMKIGTNAQAYASATFSFGANSQRNPKRFKISNLSQKKITEFSYSQMHMCTDTDGIGPRIIEFSGDMIGADRDTALRNLSSILHVVGVKRWWLNSDYFMIGTGYSLDTGFTSRQVLFRTYSGSFVCLSPFVYGATAQTHNWNITSDTTWVVSGNGMINAGNAPCHIQTITVTNNSNGNITDVRVSDATAGGGNIVKWTGTLATTKVLIIKLFEAEAGAPGYVNKLSATVDGSASGDVDYSSSNNNDCVRIEASTANQVFSAYINFAGSNDANVKLDWYNSWWE